MHQILQRDDAHQPLILDHRNDAEIARREFSEGGSQRFLPRGDFEEFVHYGLDVAVAFHTQRLQNALPRNHTHHVAAADHREIVLQGMHGLIQGIFERVRR